MNSVPRDLEARREGGCRRQTEERGFEGGMSTATNALSRQAR